MEKQKTVKQSTVDENGNPKWFEVKFPYLFMDEPHELTLRGSFAKDENGNLYIDSGSGFTAAARRFSDALRIGPERFEINRKLIEILKADYDI